MTIQDSTDRIAAVSLQGPNSRASLKQVTDADMDALRFFRLTPANIDGLDAVITRTGYTGDLGYEIWVDADRALEVWDAVMAAGKAYRIEPAGLDALDVSRVEAGFIMQDVDYFCSLDVLIESQKSTVSWF